MKDSKNLVIGLLCAVVCIMAVAYAAFATTLNINGTATISSTWNVAITAIDCNATGVEGGQTPAVTTQSFTVTTATFAVDFKQPGDTAVCNVTITNSGTLAAKVTAITTSQSTNPDITFSTSGISTGTTIAANGGTNTLTINAAYPSVGEQNEINGNNKTITVTIDYGQDL